MKQKLIFGLLVALIVLTACSSNSVETKDQSFCNKPYIQVGADCCLDKDDNSICDKDEVQEVTPTVDLESGLRTVANKYARLYETDKFAEMYDLLTDERKNAISKEKYVDLYAPVYFGVTEIYDDDVVISRQIHSNRIHSVSVDSVEVDGEIGFVKFIMTPKRGDEYTSNTFIFKYEEGEWKRHGDTYLAYVGCYETDECNSNELKIMCEQSCIDEKNIPLREEDSYICKENSCKCRCWDEESQSGFNVNPSTKYVIET